MNEDQVDHLLAALAHTGRRQILDLLMAEPGLSMKALASHFDVSRIAVLKHVRVLEQAELVLSRKQGRERQLFFNAVPLQRMHDRWTTQYSAFWGGHMSDIKSRVEQRATKDKDKKSA